MEPIKMVDLHSQYLRIKTEIDDAIQHILTTTEFIQGPQVNAFAEALAQYTGSKYVIPCANGTDALQIAMMALDFKPGNEVILPVHTYVATAEVIALLGLVPIFVDVDAMTFNIDIVQAESKITNKTVAVVPVHLYGQPANMEPLIEFATKYSIHIIEDAAQALGAEYLFADGSRKQAGTMGIIGTTSFFPSKNLGCYGDGGALFTQEKALAEKIKMIANHGQRIKYHHDTIGVNSRLDTLQAAILQVKLKYLNEYAGRRRDVAAFYDRELSGIDGLEIPFRSKYCTHVYHQYTLKIKEGRRNTLRDYLQKNGVPTMIYYPMPLHFQKAYQRTGVGPNSFPVTEKLSEEVISLPIHTEMELTQLMYICNCIKSFFNA